MPLPPEICLDGDERAIQDALMDAIDAASDQDRTTWLTDSGGQRIAKIAPVDEIPDELLNPPQRALADDEVAELLEFAGQVRAAMARTSQAYDTLFGQAGSRLLRAGIAVSRESLRVRGPQASLAGYAEKLPVGRDLLVQVLTDAGLDQAKAGTVWDVLRSLILEIHPDGKPVSWPPAPDNDGTDRQDYEEPCCGNWNPHHQHDNRLGGFTLNCPGVRPGGRFDRSGRPEDAAVRMTPRAPLTLEVVFDVLSLTGLHVSLEVIAGWTYSQRADAYDWAMREHLAASDNEVQRAPRPPFIPGAESLG